MTLQFNYDNIDEKSFSLEDGNIPFDKNSKNQMLSMMKIVCNQLKLNDEYSIKKLEMMLRYELPTFTVTRKLVQNWVIANFVY